MKCLFGLLIVCVTSIASAEFMMPQFVPVDRVIENTSRYIANHPDDAQGYYTLGRAHYLAWSLKLHSVQAFSHHQEDELPALAPDWMIYREHLLQSARQSEAHRRARAEAGLEPGQRLAYEEQEKLFKRQREIMAQLKKENWQPPRPTEEELDHHAAEARIALTKAIAMQQDSALFHMTYGSLLEEYAERAAELGLALEDEAGADAIKEAWLIAALIEYRKAYELALPQDSELESQPIGGIDSLVSYNAIGAYMRLDKQLGIQNRHLRYQMNLRKEKFQRLPIHVITPIVFSLKPVASLNDLLIAHSVDFDLDGDGLVEAWSWVSPDTGILVWDPLGLGEITCGRQLFGNATWWMLFDNGYRAMETLDDNGDGELAGDELAGLAVWFDRDSDGVSDPGEVVAIADLPIAALATRPTDGFGDTLTHPAGLRLTDGSTRATWDWVAHRR